MDIKNSAVEIGHFKIKAEPPDIFVNPNFQDTHYQPIEHSEILTDDVPAESVTVPDKASKRNYKVEPITVKMEPIDTVENLFEQPAEEICFSGNIDTSPGNGVEYHTNEDKTSKTRFLLYAMKEEVDVTEDISYENGGEVIPYEDGASIANGGGADKCNTNDFKKEGAIERDGIVVIYTCCFCGKEFKDYESFNMHMSVHEWDLSIEGIEDLSESNTKNMNPSGNNSGNKVHNCQLCGKSFKFKGNLTHHMKIHSDDKSNECEFCRKRFVQTLSLKKHTLKHGNENCFRCNFCNKPFIQKESLAIHIYIHIIERPLRCNWCNKCFNRYSILKDHLNVHLRIDTKRKHFKCRFCEKCFYDNRNLNDHIRIHTKEKPFRCSFCEKCFCQKSNQRRHMRIHTKEKPFRCDFCERDFSDRSSLNRHIRIHTKETPYTCTICRKKFNQNHHLKRHLITHTND